MAKQSPEGSLVKSLLAILPLKFKPLILWRNNTGATQTLAGGFMRFGEVGSPDIMGILGPSGRFVGFECKAPKGRPSEAQGQWLLRAASQGALVGIVRTVDEALRMLETGECNLTELVKKEYVK